MIQVCRVLCLLTVIAFHGAAFGQDKPSPPAPHAGVEVLVPGEKFDIVRLGKHSYAVQAKSGAYSFIGCNTGFVVMESGVYVIDAHHTAEAQRLVLDEIRKISSLPIRALIHTHHHDDHFLGNVAFPKETSILAHPAAIEARKLEEGEVRLPDKIISLESSLTEQGVSLRFLPIGPAHSVGDVAVYVPDDGVLYLGDLYVRGYVGYLAEAHLREWVAALDRLTQLKIRIAVPGHGLIGDAAPVREYRNYLRDFAQSAKKHFDEKGTVETYQLPSTYDALGSRSYIPKNVERAYELWKEKKLDF